MIHLSHNRSVFCTTTFIAAVLTVWRLQQLPKNFLVYANEERAHADRLANRDIQSRREPEFLQETLLSRSHTDNDTLNDLMIMVRINMATERTAVKTYCQMIALAGNKDQNTRRPFENIVVNEEQHVYEPSD